MYVSRSLKVKDRQGGDRCEEAKEVACLWLGKGEPEKEAQVLPLISLALLGQAPSCWATLIAGAEDS